MVFLFICCCVLLAMPILQIFWITIVFSRTNEIGTQCMGNLQVKNEVYFFFSLITVLDKMDPMCSRCIIVAILVFWVRELSAVGGWPAPECVFTVLFLYLPKASSASLACGGPQRLQALLNLPAALRIAALMWPGLQIVNRAIFSS